MCIRDRSIVSQLVFVFFLAVFGGLSGPGIYGAQYFGQGNKKGYQNVFRLKIWITAAITICGLIAFVFGGEKMIGLYLHGNDGGIDSAKTLKDVYKRQEVRGTVVLPSFK